MKKTIIIFIFYFFAFSIFSEGWVYKKIPINPNINIDEIENIVKEILVREDKFLLVKIKKTQTIPNVKLLQPEEHDFIQRNIRIHFYNQQEFNFILKLGIDIWEKNKNIVIGRAFDSQIQKMRSQNIVVEELLNHK